jgi:hypothetical protein
MYLVLFCKVILTFNFQFFKCKIKISKTFHLTDMSIIHMELSYLPVTDCEPLLVVLSGP